MLIKKLPTSFEQDAIDLAVRAYGCERKYVSGLLRKGITAIGAFSNDTLAGFCTADIKTSRESWDDDEIMHICVDPAYQGQEIGSSLMETMLAVIDTAPRAHKKDRNLISDVLDTNPRSQHLHEKFGFVRHRQKSETYIRGPFSHILKQMDNEPS